MAERITASLNDFFLMILRTKQQRGAIFTIFPVRESGENRVETASSFLNDGLSIGV